MRGLFFSAFVMRFAAWLVEMDIKIAKAAIAAVKAFKNRSERTSQNA